MLLVVFVQYQDSLKLFIHVVKGDCMRNLRLGLKLGGGFLLTALIVVCVGFIGVHQLGKVAEQEHVLTEESLPAVKYVLLAKAEIGSIDSIMRSLLSPYLPVVERLSSTQKLQEIRKKYVKDIEEFEKLAFAQDMKEEWDNFRDNIEEWTMFNTTAQKISQNLVKIKLSNPLAVQQQIVRFESAQRDVLTELSLLFIKENNQWKSGVKTNLAEGMEFSLQKWFAQHPNSQNPEIMEKMSTLGIFFMNFQRSVKNAEVLIASGELEEAGALMTKRVYPNARVFFGVIDELKVIVNKAADSFVQMNSLVLTDGEEAKARTFASLDRVVENVVEKSNDVTVRTEAIITQAREMIIGGMVLGVIVAIVFGLFLTKLITQPIFAGVALAQKMASGDMTGRVEVKSRDEIGTLALSLNDMADQLQKMMIDITGRVEALDTSSDELVEISDAMVIGADTTSQNATQVAASAEEMTNNQSSVAAAMEQATMNVSVVATSADQMSSTIGEIAENSSKAKTITRSAVEQSERASNRVDQLGKAATEITRVTEAITDISEQTNLLALNATIEAARAGDAGKGFAVVANEIKELAHQTSNSTLEIKEKIAGIQEATGITVREINEIKAVIADVDQIVSTIAAAVEEQNVTTTEIAENVSQAATGINEVSENVANSSIASQSIAEDIAGVNKNAVEMRGASNQVKGRAEELSEVATNLKKIMQQFTV